MNRAVRVAGYNFNIQRRQNGSIGCDNAGVRGLWG
jgi:hypothetical protein